MDEATKKNAARPPWRLRDRALPVVVLLAVALGFLLRGWWAPTPGGGPAQVSETEEAYAVEWTCSMHPQVRQPKPGLCPLCAMDLIPVAQEPLSGAGEEALEWTCSMHPLVRQPEPGICPICAMDLILAEPAGGARWGDEFVTSEAARALMKVQTAPVERRFAEAELRLVGKVAYDETKLGYITAWVPGRIERMYADYTGMQVQRGDHMVELYSPELLAAKDELRRASQALGRLSASAPGVMRQTAETSLKAIRTKLKRWGLTEAQVRQAESQGMSSDRITIYAPMSGTVIERNGSEGVYVDIGTRLYALADLSVVWVLLEAYESDLPWLHYGQPVTFTAEASPGERFEGKIAFINPVLNPDTRTVQVRVNVPNARGLLKPDMFVRGVVRSKVATGGRVMDPGLAGKWISPMHPEVVKDGPGTCDVCGMALVPAEELGFVPANAKPEDRPLVIPATAPLITGKRAVVYVEVPGAVQPTYEGREIELGPRAGAYYLVKSGLREGERVVTHGNFKIDSALQITAKPSMMSPEADVDPIGLHEDSGHKAEGSGHKAEGSDHKAEGFSHQPPATSHQHEGSEGSKSNGGGHVQD